MVWTGKATDAYLSSLRHYFIAFDDLLFQQLNDLRDRRLEKSLEIIPSSC